MMTIEDSGEEDLSKMKIEKTIGGFFGKGKKESMNPSGVYSGFNCMNNNNNNQRGYTRGMSAAGFASSGKYDR
jgi:hypothetical protein